MNHQLKNRVRGISTTTGTGSYTIASTPSGFQGFENLTSGKKVTYCAVLGSSWEVGIGTITISGSLILSRDAILDSSAGGAINWGAGSKELMLVDAAEALQSIWFDGTVRHGFFDGTLTVDGSVTLKSGVNNATAVGGTASAITATLDPAITEYIDGMLVCFTPGLDNTGGAALSVNGIIQKQIVTAQDQALAVGELIAGVPAIVQYSEAEDCWFLLNPQFQTGTFSLAISAGASSTSGTVTWRRQGRKVTIYSTVDIYALSTSNVLQFSGVPAAIRPSSAVRAPLVAGFREDLESVIMLCVIGTSGLIDCYTGSGSSGALSGIGWPAATYTKGIKAGWQISYYLP